MYEILFMNNYVAGRVEKTPAKGSKMNEKERKKERNIA